MKKKILIIILLLVTIFTLSGCRNKYRKSFDEMNMVLVDAISNEDNAKDLNVEYLSAVRYNDKYYYNVQYAFNDSVKLYDMLYIFDNKGNTVVFFEILDFEVIYNNYKEYYNEYLDAIEEGEKIVFRSKEIKKMIDDFYGF